MQFAETETGYAMGLWANETHDWARRPGAAWPRSTLSGRRVVVRVDTNGLCGIAINGGRGDQDCDGRELEAIVSDFLPASHRHLWPTWGKAKTE